MTELPTTDLHTNDGPRLQKTLRWHHWVMLALPVATGLFITAGFTIAAVGAWPAIAICVLLAVVALLQNNLFAEMAAMFPDKPGGVAVYANEAWKQHVAPLGALASFGYWTGWALVLALLGITMGSLVQAQWFPDATATFSTGLADLGLPALIGAAVVVLAIGVNLVGINIAVRVNQVVGAVFVVVLLAMIVLPFAAGDWGVANLTAHVEGPWDGWKTIITWLYVGAWAIYGSEMCAGFAPEYRDTNRDTAKAMTSVAERC